jgi:hypothetical protein
MDAIHYEVRSTHQNSHGCASKHRSEEDVPRVDRQLVGLEISRYRTWRGRNTQGETQRYAAHTKQTEGSRQQGKDRSASTVVVADHV